MKTTIIAACFLARIQRALAGVPTATGSHRTVGRVQAANKLASPLAPRGISLVSLFTVSIFAANVAARADTLTLSAAAVQVRTQATQSYSVPTNVTAQIVYAYCPVRSGSIWSGITVSITGSPGSSASFTSTAPPLQHLYLLLEWQCSILTNCRRPRDDYPLDY
jgi:hypothetical protein